MSNNNYLTHYGTLGMRWGVRRSSAGRTMFTTKRQLAVDKRDLERLNNGRHLSVGLTKKRQAAYDKRDKTILEKRIEANEQKVANKAAKKATKKKPSVKEMSDDELRKVVNRLQMERQYSQLSESNVSKGKEYMQKIIKTGTTVAAVTTTALTLYNNAEKIKKIISKG
jgi:hypothetical protein